MSASVPIPQRIRQRAAFKYVIDENGCWISTYTRQSGGYAVLSGKDDGKVRIYLAHRAAWAFANGDIPDGLVIDHRCFTRACVRPSHLRAIPIEENTRRRNGAAFPMGQCRWGHPLSEQREFQRKGRPQFFCGACMERTNREQTQMKAALHQLELAYGLGGHEVKKNYAHQIRKRQARVDEVRDARLSTSASAGRTDA